MTVKAKKKRRGIPMYKINFKKLSIFTLSGSAESA